MSPILASHLSMLAPSLLPYAARMIRHDREGLRVLLWHNVEPDGGDRYTTRLADFERQLRWLRDNRFSVLPFSEVLRRHAAEQPLPPRSVVLTFDDACAPFTRYALPALERAGFGATMMVPVGCVCGADSETAPVPGRMSIRDLDRLPESIEIGLHSFAHNNYRELDEEEIDRDVRRCAELQSRLSRPITPVLAYPFGGLPRRSARRRRLQRTLADCGVALGLRIGYGINPWPLRDWWRVRRITIHGTDSFIRYACKVTFGRVRL